MLVSAGVWCLLVLSVLVCLSWCVLVINGGGGGGAVMTQSQPIKCN